MEELLKQRQAVEEALRQLECQINEQLTVPVAGPATSVLAVPSVPAPKQRIPKKVFVLYAFAISVCCTGSLYFRCVVSLFFTVLYRYIFCSAVSLLYTDLCV